MSQGPGQRTAAGAWGRTSHGWCDHLAMSRPACRGLATFRCFCFGSHGHPQRL